MKRKFYYGAHCDFQWLLTNMKIIPVKDQIAKRRNRFQTGRYKIADTGDIFKAVYDGNDYEITCENHTLKILWTLLKIAEKNRPVRETKDIVRPVLPKTTYQIIEDTIFDFFSAIDGLETTKGFGNVGLLFIGPPGVGKSETMRWIMERAKEEYNRTSVKLGLGKLHECLTKGIELNTDGTLLFIDDIDANILRDRKITSNPLTSQFLTCIDGLDKQEGRVFVVSTNEAIDDIDPALRRPGRFDKVIKFTYPNLDLIIQFCEERQIAIPPERFEGWSFARIDMFVSRFKVMEYRYGTAMDEFYEKFIYEHGVEDETVERCSEEI